MKQKLFLLFFFAFSVVKAQVNEATLINKTFDELWALYFEHEYKISDQKTIANFFVLKGKKERNTSEIASGYYLFSLLDRENDKKKAITYLDSVIKYSININNGIFPVAAFIEKAFLLSELNEYEKTIKCYLEAEKYTKNNNDLDGYYEVRHRIGTFKSEILGEIEEAMNLYFESKEYFESKSRSDYNQSRIYRNILFSIADAHKAMHQIDSASYYNRLGYRESVIAKDEHKKFLFVLNEGANQVMNRSFSVALDSIKKGYPKMIEHKNIGNILASYYYFGRCYEGLGDNKLAIQYYQKVDSMYQIKKHINPEFVSGYHFLISHYKNINDREKQLEYLTKFMKIDSTLQRGYKKWNKLLKDQYDFPHLVADKENLIMELHQDKKMRFWIIIILGFGVVLSLILVVREVQQKKQYKKRFEALMQEQEIESVNKNEKIYTNEKSKSEDLGILPVNVDAIVKQLDFFESQLQFLLPNITVQILAQQMSTNSKYLSLIVNSKKGKTFSNYLNDLRIDYVVAELKKNKELRKYTIEAIGNEVGFNTAESFSNAFFKRTGIKPSFFIRKLQEV